MACQCGGDEYGANTIPRLMMPISYCLFVSSWKHISPFHINQQTQTLQSCSRTEGHVVAENNVATKLKSFRHWSEIRVTHQTLTDQVLEALIAQWLQFRKRLCQHVAMTGTVCCARVCSYLADWTALSWMPVLSPVAFSNESFITFKVCARK